MVASMSLATIPALAVDIRRRILIVFHVEQSNIIY